MATALELSSAVKTLFSELLGVDEDAFGVDKTFLELGADSLLLLQASQAIQDKFGVTIPLRRFLEELPTVDALTEYLERTLGRPLPRATSITPGCPVVKGDSSDPIAFRKREMFGFGKRDCRVVMPAAVGKLNPAGPVTNWCSRSHCAVPNAKSLSLITGPPASNPKVFSLSYGFLLIGLTTAS